MKLTNLFAISILSIALFSCSKSDDGFTSVPVEDNSTAAPISGQFQKRVLIEDYTGTWCGWCPRVSYGIDQVLALSIRAVPVAIHNGDPMAWGNSGTWPSAVSSFPTAKLNRTIDWSYPENSNTTQVKRLNGNNEGLGLAMNSTITNNSVNLDVKIKFAKDYTGLKLVVYVLEDNLIYNQTNYTSFYGGGATITNFDHDNVMRHLVSGNIQGDAITETTSTGSTITKNFTFNIPSNVSNANNMKFVAFVVDSNGKAINSRAAIKGENQSFEQNQ